MSESIEYFSSGREILKNLESEGKYVFHGSEKPGLEYLEPRQAHDVVDGVEKSDDNPGVHASPFSDIAILMAMVNMKNCPNGFDSGFGNPDNKLTLTVSRQGLDQLTDNSSGYVYVFSKNDFTKRGHLQSISYKKVLPIRIIEVKKSDLPNDIKIEG